VASWKCFARELEAPFSAIETDLPSYVSTLLMSLSFLDVYSLFLTTPYLGIKYQEIRVGSPE